MPKRSELRNTFWLTSIVAANLALACGASPEKPAAAPAPLESSANMASASMARPIASSAPAGVRYTGGDGTGCGEIVMIEGATTQAAGGDAERAWLALHRPGSEVVGQTLTTCSKHPVDKVHVRTADGRASDVYFDATTFYGKF